MYAYIFQGREVFHQTLFFVHSCVSFDSTATVSIAQTDQNEKISSLNAQNLCVYVKSGLSFPIWKLARI